MDAYGFHAISLIQPEDLKNNITITLFYCFDGQCGGEYRHMHPDSV